MLVGAVEAHSCHRNPGQEAALHPDSWWHKLGGKAAVPLVPGLGGDRVGGSITESGSVARGESRV
jgi:hypothetical protein